VYFICIITNALPFRDSHNDLLLYSGFHHSSVDDIDLYAAGIAERVLAGGMIGPTFGCIIGRQFRNIRVGDRFWHERRDAVVGLTYGEYSVMRLIHVVPVRMCVLI
jgi:hypothetical protein